MLISAAPVSVSVSWECLAPVSHIKAPLCLKQAHLVWLMSLLAMYVCVYAEGSLKENGNKTKHRWDLTECSFSTHYSELALKASSPQKLSMLLPMPRVHTHACVFVCAVLTVPFIAHLATLSFYHCLAPLTSQRDNIRAFYRIIPLLKRKLFSCAAHWPSISHIHYIYILVMWQMLLTKRFTLYTLCAHIPRRQILTS